MTPKTKTAKITLLCLIGATLLFIFSQSMLPPETSSSESEAFSEILELVLPSDTALGSFVHSNIRKIAHFLEYALLGFEVALYVAIFEKRKIFIAISYPFALFTALLDESIQIFSGRGPSVVDVWIDFFGFFTFASLIYLTRFLVFYFNKRRNET